MASAEHRAQIGQELGIKIPTTKPLDWPKIDIEVDVPPETGECQDSCRPAFVTRVALSTSGFWHVRQA